MTLRSAILVDPIAVIRLCPNPKINARVQNTTTQIRVEHVTNSKTAVIFQTETQA